MTWVERAQKELDTGKEVFEAVKAELNHGQWKKLCKSERFRKFVEKYGVETGAE